MRRRSGNGKLCRVCVCQEWMECCQDVTSGTIQDRILGLGFGFVVVAAAAVEEEEEEERKGSV